MFVKCTIKHHCDIFSSYLDIHFSIYRRKFDEMFGTEPVTSEQTPPLPPAMDAFQEVTKFVKIYNFEKDSKRFEIFTR